MVNAIVVIIIITIVIINITSLIIIIICFNTINYYYFVFKCAEMATIIAKVKQLLKKRKENINK